MRQPNKFRGPERSSDLVDAGSSNTTGALQGIANTLSNVSSSLGAVADRAAQRKGDEAGAVAGLDPEFRQRSDGSIESEAFNASGLRSLATQTDLTLRQKLAELYEANPDDPVAFKAGSDALREEYVGKLKGQAPQLLPNLTAGFERAKFGYDRDYARQANARMRDEKHAEAIAVADDVGKDIVRSAYSIGLDDQSNTVLAGELGAFSESLLAHGPAQAFEFDGKKYPADPSRSGAFTLSQIQGQLESVSDRVAEARVKGAFDRTGGLAEKTAFAEQLRADFLGDKGLGGALSLEALEGLERYIGQDIRGLQAEDRSRQAALRSELTDVKSQIREYRGFAADGLTPSPEHLDALEARARQLGGGDALQEIQQIRATTAIVSEALKRPPHELQNEVNNIRRALSDGATPEQRARLGALESALSKSRQGLAHDPVNFGIQNGLVPQIELNLLRDQGGVENIVARRSRKTYLEQTYGVEAALFTEDERTRIAQVEKEDPAAIAGVALSFVEALGSEASAHLQEISKNAPNLAHYGGLISNGGSPQAVQYAGKGAKLRADNPEVQPNLRAVNGETSREIAQQHLSQALASLPGTRARIESVATDIYIGRKGLNAPFDRQEFETAITEAAGGRVIGNVQFGGIAKAKGKHRVIAPGWLRADKTDDVFRSLTLEDYTRAGGEPRTDDGEPFTERDLRRAYPVPVGPGQYYLSIKDPKNGSPEWVAGDGPDGRYILDLDNVRDELASRRPDWVNP